MSDTLLQQEEKKKLPLYEYAYLGKMEEVLNKLKNIAMVETWDYSNQTTGKQLPILFNYLHHTFTRIKEENKIVNVNKYSCFNTGLVTPNQEEIFMLFKESNVKENSFYFLEFCKESNNNMIRFNPLPVKASYFTSMSELFYDSNLELRINIDHIIEDEDNFNRFPPHIKALNKHQLINTFHGAIEHAKKRVKRNYKTAIPQFYRGKYSQEGQLQLLLPLCLTDTCKADLALAIYKNDNSYMGRTCLTLDMAINNARLITKPDDEWLKP